MKHPFELKISDLEALELDFVEPLTDESAQKITGGAKVTTEYVTANRGEAGEEGGGGHGATTEYVTVPHPGEAAEEGGGLCFH
ncbi:MAG: hypothetical protein ACYTXA_10835 [Nostoc sp.]